MTALYMVLAIASEVGWAIAMKLSVGFTRPRYVALTVFLYLLSVVFLAFATRRMDVGTGYAIWAGSGVALIAVAGVLYFHEPLSWARVAGLLLVVAGIVLLQWSGGGH